MVDSMKYQNKAFTLIELLIVIAIIGILASIVLVSLNAARSKAKQAKASLELKQMSTLIQMAQNQNGKSLKDITSNTCSDCDCRSGADMTTVPTSHACYTNWSAARIAIAAETGQGADAFDDPVTDPWGSPYGLDENEGELSGSPCIPDSLRSYGPDGMFDTGDDVAVVIPFSGNYSCP